MLSGWREQGLAASVAVDPAPDAARMAGPDLTGSCRMLPPSRRVSAPAAVVLAVREAAKRRRGARCLLYARNAGQAVFLSIMAGRTIRGMRSAAGRERCDRTGDAEHAGGGASGRRRCLSRRRRQPSPRRVLCERLLQAYRRRCLGLTMRRCFDPVTAVSGSGPAYVFLLVVDGTGGAGAGHPA